jgi:hypothetical protein
MVRRAKIRRNFQKISYFIAQIYQPRCHVTVLSRMHKPPQNLYSTMPQSATYLFYDGALTYGHRSCMTDMSCSCRGCLLVTVLNRSKALCVEVCFTSGPIPALLLNSLYLLALNYSMINTICFHLWTQGEKIWNGACGCLVRISKYPGC